LPRWGFFFALFLKQDILKIKNQFVHSGHSFSAGIYTMFGAAIASAQGFMQCLERPQLQRRDLCNVWSGHAFSAGIYTMFGAAAPSAQVFFGKYKLIPF